MFLRNVSRHSTINFQWNFWYNLPISTTQKKHVFLSTNCNSALSFEWNYLRWRTKLSQICFRMTLGQKIWCVFVLNVLLKFPCVIASENMANAVYSTIQPEQPPPPCLRGNFVFSQFVMWNSPPCLSGSFTVIYSKCCPISHCWLIFWIGHQEQPPLFKGILNS